MRWTTVEDKELFNRTYGRLYETSIDADKVIGVCADGTQCILSFLGGERMVVNGEKDKILAQLSAAECETCHTCHSPSS